MTVNLTRRFVIPVLGLILFFSSPGYSIRCWICDSYYNPECADPFNNTAVSVIDCASIPIRPPLNPDVKLTRCGTIEYRLRDNPTTFIARTCLPEEKRFEEFPCSSHQTTNFGKTYTCSSCSYDLCNSAPASFQVTSALLVVPVAMILTKISIL